MRREKQGGNMTTTKSYSDALLFCMLQQTIHESEIYESINFRSYYYRCIHWKVKHSWVNTFYTISVSNIYQIQFTSFISLVINNIDGVDVDLIADHECRGPQNIIFQWLSMKSFGNVYKFVAFSVRWNAISSIVNASTNSNNSFCIRNLDAMLTECQCGQLILSTVGLLSPIWLYEFTLISLNNFLIRFGGKLNTEHFREYNCK